MTQPAYRLTPDDESASPPTANADPTPTATLRYHPAQTEGASPDEPRQPMVLHARVVTGQGGGPEKTIMHSAQYADRAGLKMAAVYVRPRHDPGFAALRQRAREEGCQLWEVPEIGPVDPRTVRRLAKLCQKLKVDIWHAHDHKTDFLGLLLRRLWPMKLVTTLHGWTNDTTRMRLYYHVDQWSIRRYDRVIAVSHPLIEHCRAHGVEDQRLRYVANAIEPDDYRRTQDIPTAREALELDRDHFAILMVGRLSSEKGIDRAIHTIARLRRQQEPVVLHLVGDGPARAGLEQQARELGVADAVRFWGWQADPKPWYEMANLLLLTSHTEGLPNVVFEAMALGVPVAATNVGGVRQQLDQGNCGLLLDPDHEVVWPNQIAALIRDHGQRMFLARQAGKRVVDHYSFRHRMDKVFSIYSDVLDGAPIGLPQPMRQAA